MNLKSRRKNKIIRGGAASGTTQKLLNALMKKGKKSTAEKVVRRLCETIEIKENKKSMSFIHYAIQAIRPLVGWSEKQGRNRKSKPIPLSIQTSERFAIKWIIEGAKKRPERSMTYAIYLELLNAYIGKKSFAMSKREELHNVCKATYFRR